MARKAMRAAKPLGWWRLEGARSLWILGPRIAVNRALDAAIPWPPGSVPSSEPSRAWAFLRRRFSRRAAASRSSLALSFSPYVPARRSAWRRASRVDGRDPLGHSARLLRQCCRSSVVERILGKAEVVSSILTGSTIFRLQPCRGTWRSRKSRSASESSSTVIGLQETLDDVVLDDLLKLVRHSVGQMVANAWRQLST